VSPPSAAQAPGGAGGSLRQEVSPSPADPRASPGRQGREDVPSSVELRITAAVVLALAVTHTGAGGPPAAGLITGIGIWLVLTARGDLAPPPGR
jgi:hypothetical protein